MSVDSKPATQRTESFYLSPCRSLACCFNFNPFLLFQWFRWKAITFNEHYNTGFRNLLGDQLRMIEIELKGKGHEAVFFVGNMIKAAKALRKITIVYSREYYSEMLSKMRNEISPTVLLSLEVNLVEKEFDGYEDPEL